MLTKPVSPHFQSKKGHNSAKNGCKITVFELVLKVIDIKLHTKIVQDLIINRHTSVHEASFCTFSVNKRAITLQNSDENDGFQWQWVVHCVSIKRKKYLLVMDYHSRYCIMFPAGKKGDDIEFLNSFEALLKANFRYWVDKNEMDQNEASQYIEQYDACINTCTFHQRGDRSVQAHMKEVVWHLQTLVERQGSISERLDCLLFSVAAAGIYRKRKGEKDYFQADLAFFTHWLKTFSPQVITNNVINLNQFRSLH